MSKEEFKKTIEELVAKFDRNVDRYKDQSSSFNETQLRIEFIDPMFEALGWDMNNKAGAAEQYKEVIHEDKVYIEGKPKAPDYSFKFWGERKFFLEAKQPFVKIKTDYKPALQLRRYAWSAHLPVSILSDFEELAIYDTTIEPKATDKASVARLQYYKYTDYLEKWEEIYDLFAKESIQQGSFDKFIAKEKRGSQLVDKVFLKEIENWREWLAKDIAKHNSKLTVEQLNFAVQKIIDRIIFLRIAEDRGIERYKSLENIIKSKNSYPELVRYFKTAHEKYNSGLFDFEEDTITPELKVSDKLLDKILEHLYYPNSPYEFSVLGVELLGSIYEQFLGKVIRLTAGHNAKVEEKLEVKKAGGVFYTPQYIVEYIVKNTVGELLEGKSIKQAEKIKVLDPACGSGSFLIGAYEFLLNWHLTEYEKLSDKEKEKLEKKGVIYKQVNKESTGESIESWQLTTNEKKRIMLNNIYGVDIDKQAVEVTKLSLALKMLENENQQSINKQMKLFAERILPDMSGNIKCGNSLVGSDYWDPSTGSGRDLMEVTEEEIKKVNAFDWEEEFSEILSPSPRGEGRGEVVLKENDLVLFDQGVSSKTIKMLKANHGIWSYQTLVDTRSLDEIENIEEVEKYDFVERDDTNINKYIDGVIYPIRFTSTGDIYHSGDVVARNKGMIISDKNLINLIKKVEKELSKIFRKDIVNNNKADYEILLTLILSKNSHLKFLKTDKNKMSIAAEHLSKGFSMFVTNDKKGIFDKEYRGQLAEKFNISIVYEEEISEKEIKKGGFDAVIGNPPYLRIQGLQEFSPETVPYLKEKFYSAQSGNIDIYVIFLEKVLDLLSKDGLNGFILPHKFFNADMGKNIREIITDKKAINKIVSFKEKQIFEFATTYTCLFFMSGKQNNSILYAEQNTDESSDKFLLGVEEFGEIPHPKKNQKTWRFYEPHVQKVMDKLLSQEKTLEDYAEKIFVGLQTSADKIYVLTEIEIKDHTYIGYSKQLDRRVEIEKGLFKLFLKGQDVHRYEFIEPDKVVLFPYLIEGDNSELMTLEYIKENYPLGYEYLLENKKVLEAREKGKFKSTWWQFGRNQGLTEFQTKRIVTPEIGNKSNFSICSANVASTSTVYSLKFEKRTGLSNEFMLGFLNAPILWFFLSNTGTVLRGGYFRFKTNYLNPFPMPNFDINDSGFKIVHDEISKLVEIQLSNHMSLAQADSEIKKQLIQKQIDATDEKINTLVYELYGLTQEEIDVIEESIGT